MGYRLKPTCPAYVPVEGECAGLRFEHSSEYSRVPLADLDKFISSKVITEQQQKSVKKVKE